VGGSGARRKFKFEIGIQNSILLSQKKAKAGWSTLGFFPLPYYLGTTVMLWGFVIEYGEPGASLTPVEVTANTYSWPAGMPIAYR
jgi:hypothetical protein